MKFCTSCIFHLGPSVQMTITADLAPATDFSRCGHDLALDRSVFLVTGKPQHMRRLYASTMRLPNSPCGPDAFLHAPANALDDLAPSDFPTIGDDE